MANTFNRVVIINDTTIARGGAAQLALQLTRNLVERGERVTFFAGDYGDDDELKSLGVDVRAIGGEPLLQSRRGFVDGVWNAKAAAALKALIAEIDDPGVVYHVHSWSQILSPSVFAALAPIAERVAVTAHDFFLACPNGNYSIYPKSKRCELTPMSARCVATHCDKRRYAHKLWRVARQVALNNATNLRRTPFTVFAIQAGMIAYLTRGGVPEKRINVVTNPATRLVDTRVAAENNSEVLYVGRLEHEKGVDLLAAAVRAVGATLRVIGAGDEEHAVRRANPDALFQGWTTPGEIADAFQKARFVVMPSRCTEPFGLAAAEALRAGVPVLASKSCLIGPDIKVLGMGDICDVFDEGAFRSVIADWMSEPEKIRSMSIAAFDRATEIAQTETAWVDAHVTHYNRFTAPSASQ